MLALRGQHGSVVAQIVDRRLEEDGARTGERDSAEAAIVERRERMAQAERMACSAAWKVHDAGRVDLLHRVEQTHPLQEWEGRGAGRRLAGADGTAVDQQHAAGAGQGQRGTQPAEAGADDNRVPATISSPQWPGE